MKKVHLAFLLAIVFITSCSKSKIHSLGDDFGCINREVPNWRDPKLTTANATVAKDLFQSNGLSADNLWFTRLKYDTIVLNGATNYYVYIQAQEFLNDLPVFTSFPGYYFKNGAQELPDMNRLVGSTTLNNYPDLRMSQVRKLYVDQLYAQHYAPDYIKSFKDSCLSATFGYYDMNAGSSYQPVKLTKAWRVHPAHSDTPYAFFKDDGTLIFFSTGIVF